jgi:hypothetical protein
VDFDYITRRPALESDNVGWRRYPVSMIGILEGSEFSLEMGLEISSEVISLERSRSISARSTNGLAARKAFSPRHTASAVRRKFVSA